MYGNTPLLMGSCKLIEVTVFRVASTEFAGMLPGGRKGTCGTIRFRLAGWNHVSAGSQNRAHSLDRIRQPSRHRQLYQQCAACQVSVKAAIFLFCISGEQTLNISAKIFPCVCFISLILSFEYVSIFIDEVVGIFPIGQAVLTVMSDEY